MPIIVSDSTGSSSLFFDITAALDSRLGAMSDLPPVAWENRPFNPTKDTLYLRPVNNQGESVAITQDQDETIGVYSIGIIAPAGDGKNELVLMTDKVANWMKQDASFSYMGQTVRVRNVSRTSASNDGKGWLHATVDVVYYVFSDRR